MLGRADDGHVFKSIDGSLPSVEAVVAIDVTERQVAAREFVEGDIITAIVVCFRRVDGDHSQLGRVAIAARIAQPGLVRLGSISLNVTAAAGSTAARRRMPFANMSTNTTLEESTNCGLSSTADSAGEFVG